MDLDLLHKVGIVDNDGFVDGKNSLVKDESCFSYLQAVSYTAAGS